MALKPCKECKKMVSTKASKCPHCGVSSPGVSTANQFMALAILVAIGLIIYEAASDDPQSSQPTADPVTEKPSKKPSKTPEQIAAEEAACKSDLQCWGDKNNIDATIRCDDFVERLANYQFEWTDGWTESKFSHFRWLNKAQGQVTYIGDKIKFQNGFGAWTNVVYECDFDPELKSVLSVRANPGRL